MKKNMTIACCFISIFINAQTYSVGHLSVNFKDPSRTGGYAISGTSVISYTGTGRTIGTEVYYPSTTNGENTAIAVIGQFPVVVMGHGFAMAWSSYDNIYTRIASLGYVVLLPRTEGGTIFPPPNHADFAMDLAYVAKQGLLFNTINTPTAIAMFNGRITQKSAIGGHSMGGGASYLAAANNTTATCLFNFAAATTNNNPNSIAQASLVTIPSLVISGQLDNVADSTVQNSHYVNLSSTKKFHVIIKDLTHCDVGNGTDALCTIGQAACNTPSCNSIYFQRYMTYLEPFLANQLKNDCSEGQRFMDSIQSNSSNRVGRKITGTLICTTTSLFEQTNLLSLTVYPNPTKDIVTIKFGEKINQLVSFELYNSSGNLIFKTNDEINEQNVFTKKFNLYNYNKGLYILIVKTNNGIHSQKLIKD